MFLVHRKVRSLGPSQAASPLHASSVCLAQRRVVQATPPHSGRAFVPWRALVANRSALRNCHTT